MTVDEFIAQGGKITYCPPAYVGVVNGATPLSSGTEVQLESWKEGVSRIFNRKGYPERKKNSHTFRPGQGPTATSFKPGVRSRGAEIQAARGAARLERLTAEYTGGKTIEDMARDEGCRPTRIRELLRKAGVL